LEFGDRLLKWGVCTVIEDFITKIYSLHFTVINTDIHLLTCCRWSLDMCLRLLPDLYFLT